MNVYVMYNKNKEVLYVGQTKNMNIRMSQHFGSQKEDWKKDVYKIKYMDCLNEVVPTIQDK